MDIEKCNTVIEKYMAQSLKKWFIWILYEPTFWYLRHLFFSLR